MFLGHFALGFAATRSDSRLRLGDALLAAQLPDAVWPVLVLAGVERVTIAPGDTVVTPLRFDSYPISHSLLTVALWGAALGGLYAWRTGRAKGGLLLALLAVSHWLLDFATHRPDMPLTLGAGAKLGLGLWNSLPATLLVEATLFAAGVWLYWKARVRDRGRLALATLVATLAAIYLANLFGPPPPSVAAIGWSGVLVTPLVWMWANWVDRRISGPAVG